MSLFALQCVISVIFVPCAALDRACCRVLGQGVKKNDYQCVIWWLLGHNFPLKKTGSDSVCTPVIRDT